MLLIPHLSVSNQTLQQFWSDYTIHWLNLPQGLSRADVLLSGGSLYRNKLQSQGQVWVYLSKPGRLLIYGFKWRIIQMKNYTIFSIYIYLKTHKQYIHVFTDLLCENWRANIIHTSQNRINFYGTPAQPFLMAAMLVKILTLCCWNPLSNCFMNVLFWQWHMDSTNIEFVITDCIYKKQTCTVIVAFYVK